jgi:hypothetical protein
MAAALINQLQQWAPHPKLLCASLHRYCYCAPVMRAISTQTADAEKGLKIVAGSRLLFAAPILVIPIHHVHLLLEFEHGSNLPRRLHSVIRILHLVHRKDCVSAASHPDLNTVRYF